jgi:dipeptidyl aminopeptidase/acylaminoacyl peptidase
MLLRDEVVDPYDLLTTVGASPVPVGARFQAGPVVQSRYFDPASEGARLHRMLEKAFAGQEVRITSSTADDKLALVLVSGPRNPGDFYLFDVVNRKAELVLSQAEWIDPEAMGEVRAVTLKARDGLDLHGVLTLPPGSDGRNLPMVVNPHGGPFNAFDDFSYSSEAQMLAKAGYAVLQINFRGSGNRGREFAQAGARQWGKAMQDDVTDATKWAVAQGIADGSRVCIYGGSYGAYAALMGAVREPTLYRCAAGYVGVYDLDKLVRDDSAASTYLRNFSTQWIGEAGTLAAVSPNRLAERIEIPVFLAAGGEDKVAPIEHTKLMESALRSAGGEVESLYYPHEAHGFYTEEHRREYYTRLLAFLSRHLGGAPAAGGRAGAAAGR